MVKIRKNVHTGLHLCKLESIMRALSDALPTGHRAMANPTLQLHFGCGGATLPASHSHNWPSGRIQHFCSKLDKKVILLPIKTQKLISTLEWYYRSLYCRSKAMIFFFLNGQLEGDIICCHLKHHWYINKQVALSSKLHQLNPWIKLNPSIKLNPWIKDQLRKAYDVSSEWDNFLSVCDHHQHHAMLSASHSQSHSVPIWAWRLPSTIATGW